MIELSGPVAYLRRVKLFSTRVDQDRHGLIVQMIVYSTERRTATVTIDALDMSAEKIEYPLIFGHITALFKHRRRYQKKRNEHGKAKRYTYPYDLPTCEKSRMEFEIPEGFWRLPPVGVTYTPRDPGTLHVPTLVRSSPQEDSFGIDCFVQGPVILGEDEEWEESQFPAAVTVSQAQSGGIVSRDRHVYRAEKDGTTADTHLTLEES